MSDCLGDPKGVYILAASTLNSFALIVLIVVVAVALWKIYRQQRAIISWILDVDKEAGNGRFNFERRGSPRGTRDTYAPIRSSSPETVRDELPLPQSSPPITEVRQQDRLGGSQLESSVKVDNAVKPALTRKTKLSLSLPRGKTKRSHAAAANHHLDMKRVTNELRTTEQFQRTSGESDVVLGPREEEGSPANRAFGTLERHTANRSNRDGAGDGNEYAMTLITNKPDRPAPKKTAGNPFYFQLNGATHEADDDTGAEAQEIRNRRSMSDASFVQSAVSRFPLKMIFDKSGRSSKQRQREAKKTKPEDQPLPLVEDTHANEYEHVNRESSLVKRPRHTAVTTAESDGGYSKLNRKATKDNGVAPAEGYDRISTETTPISTDMKNNSKASSSLID